MKDERSNLVKKKKLRVLGKSWNVYKNIPSSDLTNEYFSLQVLLLNHSNTSPIYCDTYLIH